MAKELVWPADRLDELDLFKSLLRECESIDSANGIIRRLRLIEDIALRLNSYSEGRKRRSFYRFLEDLAVRDE